MHNSMLKGFAVSALSLAVSLGCGGLFAATTPDLQLDQIDARLGRATEWQALTHQGREPYFDKIATYPLFHNRPTGEDPSTETMAEIVTATEDGNTLIYTDGVNGRIGLVDIRNAAEPQGLGTVTVGGEPTSVAVAGRFALVAVDTSESFTRPSGALVIVNINDPSAPRIVATRDLPGQPDSIAVDPQHRWAAVVIENERDEEYNGGLLPQAPGGALVVVDMTAGVAPGEWVMNVVDLTGLTEIAPNDPEPELVDINANGQAVVSFQENNHIAVIDLATREVVSHFSAGAINLRGVDVVEDGLTRFDGTLTDRRREPDGVSWIGTRFIATANEGDYEDAAGVEGGSRGFSIFDLQGNLVYDSRERFEYLAAAHGHHNDGRSENKGAEPEGVEWGRFGDRDFLFVNSERSNFIAVYEVTPRLNQEGFRGLAGIPVFHQLLSTTISPEGVKAIPGRNLLVASSEVDDAGNGVRAAISLYRLANRAKPAYPQIVSADLGDTARPPISWAALSGLAASRTENRTLYAVHDDAIAASRILTIDAGRHPARITGEMGLRKNGSAVGYDLEGISQAADGGFWLVSEGDGDARQNLLIKVTAAGDVEQEIALPAGAQARADKYGFEGVAVMEDGRIAVAFQREWSGDPANHVRIGLYDPTKGAWRFVYYPLQTPTSPAGGWVGLSDLTYLGNERFAVVERDNQQGEAARIKRVYTFSIAGLTPLADSATGSFPVVAKTQRRNLMPAFRATHSWTPDKVEGLAVTRDGTVFVATDNDALDGSVGETFFLNLGKAW